MERIYIDCLEALKEIDTRNKPNKLKVRLFIEHLIKTNEAESEKRTLYDVCLDCKQIIQKGYAYCYRCHISRKDGHKIIACTHCKR